MEAAGCGAVLNGTCREAKGTQLVDMEDRVLARRQGRNGRIVSGLVGKAKPAFAFSTTLCHAPHRDLEGVTDG